MKKKYINGTNSRCFDKITSETFHVDNDYKGYMSLINIQKVRYKVIVGNGESKICLYDDGYKSIVFMPDDAHLCGSNI